MVRVFIDTGDRTDRTKARLKYVLDGSESGRSSACRRKARPQAHPSGARRAGAASGLLAHRPYRHPRAEAGGVALDRHRRPGRPPDRRPDAGPGRSRPRLRRRRYPAHGLAESADLGCADRKLEAAREKIEALGLSIETNAIRSGLIACTGNTGCKFAASDTKRHAEEIAGWCETRVTLDTPVNIHLTGCHHSCAQHFVSEIGLLACKVQENEDAEPVEGYHILIGGGFGPYAALGREIYRDVKADDAPKTIEGLLKAYLAHRASREESFIDFARRHEIDALKAMAGKKRPWHEHDAAAADAVTDPRRRAIHRGAAALARRTVRRAAGLQDNVTPLSGGRGRAVARLGASAARPPKRRWRAVARPGDAAARPHEAGRGQAAAAAHDGGDGDSRTAASAATIARITRRAVRQRKAAEPLRARRERNRPHAQRALCGAWRAGGRGSSAPVPKADAGCARRAARATTRSYATFLSRRRLNKEGSEKETWHVEFDLAEYGLDYVVGDSSAFFPPMILSWSKP